MIGGVSLSWHGSLQTNLGFAICKPAAFGHLLHNILIEIDLAAKLHSDLKRLIDCPIFPMARWCTNCSNDEMRRKDSALKNPSNTTCSNNPKILCNVSTHFMHHISISQIIILFFKNLQVIGHSAFGKGTHQPLWSFSIKLSSSRWLPWSIPATRSHSHPSATSIHHGRRRHTTPPEKAQVVRKGPGQLNTLNLEILK